MKHTCKTCAYALVSKGCLKRVIGVDCWCLHPRYIILPCAIIPALLVAAACILVTLGVI
jgi:hypothetical protein